MRSGCTVLLALVASGCIDDVSLQRDFVTNARKGGTYWSCLDFPWLKNAISPSGHAPDVGIFECGCGFYYPDCNGDGKNFEAKPVEVLAYTQGHAEACGQSRCEAWVKSQIVLQFDGFQCSPAPTEWIPDWQASLPFFGERPVSSPSKLGLCGGGRLFP